MIVQKIKNATKAAGMTQKDLADAAGLSRGATSQYLSGRQKLSEKALAKIAAALNLPPDWLTDDSVTAHAPIPSRNVPVWLAARLMGKREQYIRRGLQQGILPFGYAIKGDGERYSYHISPAKFVEYTGVDLEKVEIG